MLLGRLCIWTMLFMNKVDNPFEVVALVQEIKCTILENWSITTKIELYSSTGGSSVMKSIEIENWG